MLSNFINKFKTTDLDELRAFQSNLIGRLREIYPDKSVTLLEDPRSIEFDGRTCGITNVHAAFLLGEQSESSLDEILRSHFDVFLESDIQQVLEDDFGRDWDSISTMILPQIMPAEFINKVPLIHDEFFDSLVVAYVVDSEKAYRYISEKELEDWRIDREMLVEMAYKNLEERTRGIEMMAIEPPNGFVVVNTMDGFDAVRITAERMRDYIGGIVGKPFFFGIPNREFLICWENTGDGEFYGNFARQIAADSAERPYPLSAKVFQVDEKNRISVVRPQPDLRAETADLN